MCSPSPLSTHVGAVEERQNILSSPARGAEVKRPAPTLHHLYRAHRQSRMGPQEIRENSGEGKGGFCTKNTTLVHRVQLLSKKCNSHFEEYNLCLKKYNFYLK